MYGIQLDTVSKMQAQDLDRKKKQGKAFGVADYSAEFPTLPSKKA